MPNAKILQLGAAGAGGTKYFAGIYTWAGSTNSINRRGCVYEPLDDYAQVYLVYNITSQNGYGMFTVDLTTGNYKYSRRIYSTANYTTNPIFFSRGIDGSGNANYGVPWLSSSTNVNYYFKRNSATSVTTYTQYFDGYNYFYSPNFNGMTWSPNGNPIVFGKFVNYDKPSGVIASSYNTNSSYTNKFLMAGDGGSDSITSALIYSSTQVIYGSNDESYDRPNVYKVTYNSADVIQSFVRMNLTNTTLTTDGNTCIAYRPTGDILYVSTWKGIWAFTAATLNVHPTITGRLCPTNVPNPGSAPDYYSQYTVRISYDSVNDRIYWSSGAHFVLALSTDLSTIYWTITGDFWNAEVTPKNDEDGNIIFSARCNSNNKTIIVAQLDKDASQVPTSYTTVATGLSWQRVLSGVTMSTDTATKNNDAPFSYIRTGAVTSPTTSSALDQDPATQNVVNL